MAYNLKRELNKPERLAGGHRLCAGCGAGIAVRGVLRALEEGDKAVIGNATGCLEVSTFNYPNTAYYDSYIHTAFENAGATLSGVEAAYNVLKKKGKVKDTFKFITFGGDGGTYDIGLQSLSGAMERGHDMVYVCYDNEAYMNTGIQRASSTPRFADATTSPAGTEIPGKQQNKKNLTEIMAAHNIPYVGAGANIEEAEKPIYINVNGIKIGFISACNAEKNRFTPGATENSPGIFLMYDHTDLINKCVDASKRCDYLIAFLHWGNEDSKYYTNDQHNLASELINDGADAIIGAHPHVLQGMEYINECPVVYSLGDFWFNSETKYNGLISLDINSNGYVNMSIVPTIQSEFTTSKISNQEELNKYRDYINSLSSGCSVDENFNFITRN